MVKISSVKMMVPAMTGCGELTVRVCQVLQAAGELTSDTFNSFSAHSKTLCIRLQCQIFVFLQFSGQVLANFSEVSVS